MVNAQFITGNYHGKDSSIHLWFRDEEGNKDFLKIVGFEPHFFVPVGSQIPDIPRFRDVLDCDVPGLFGEKLWRLNVSDPASVSGMGRGDGLRDYFEKHWEADVRFIDRLLINIGVYSGFLSPGRKVVHYKDLKPVDFTLDPLISFFDIEVHTKTRFPNYRLPNQKIISITVWDSKYRKYITFMLSPTHKEKEVVGNWIKVYCDTEREIINLTKEYFDRVKPDVISGWNVEFDVKYFLARARNLKIYTNFQYACIFDLLGGYKFLHKSLGNRLKEVVIKEGIAKEVVSEEFHLEYWERTETREKFMLYNKKDVEYCVMLDEGFTDVNTGEKKKYDIIKFFWDLKNFVGKEDMSHMTHGLLIDLLLLRKAHGKFILPSRPPKAKRGKSFRAAVVFEPPEGVFGAKTDWTGVLDPDEMGVAVLDMSRYYPNILKAYYEKRLRFSSDPKERLFPDIIDDLYALREKYEGLMERYDFKSDEYRLSKRRRDLCKSPLLSGVWGYIGWSGSRVFDRDKAEYITEKARDGLELAKKSAEELGREIIYGDTDSVMTLTSLNDVEGIVEALNKVFTSYCEKEGIPSLLQIKMDRFYRKALWIEAEGKGRAAKKRYMGHCVREGNKVVDYIHAKGFEMIRGDSSKVTRLLQADVGDAILRKGTKGLISRIKTLTESMKNGEFPYNDIAITKQLHLDLKGRNVDYYRGARYGNEKLGFDIRPGDLVKMLYVHRVHGFPSTDVLCYLDQDKLPKIQVNYEKMVDRTVKNKVKRLLRIGGMDWMSVEGYSALEDFF